MHYKLEIKYGGKEIHGVVVRDGEQVLVDGIPAVIVLRHREGHELFSPGSPRPIQLLGMQFVGQWASHWRRDLGSALMDTDTALRYTLVGKIRIEPNTDPDTHIQYEAWVQATHEVYSNS